MSKSFVPQEPATVTFQVDVDANGNIITSPLSTPANTLNIPLKMLKADFDSDTAQQAYAFCDFFITQAFYAYTGRVTNATVKFNFQEG